MHNRRAGMKQIDDVIPGGGTGGDRWIKYRNPWHRRPLALSGTALYQQASAEFAECFLHGIFRIATDELR